MNEESSKLASFWNQELLGAPYAQRLRCLELAITSARSSRAAGEAFQHLAGYATALEDAQVIDREQAAQLRAQGQLLHIEALERLQSLRMPQWEALIIALSR
jgi:hypothetical protein